MCTLGFVCSFSQPSAYHIIFSFREREREREIQACHCTSGSMWSVSAGLASKLNQITPFCCSQVWKISEEGDSAATLDKCILVSEDPFYFYHIHLECPFCLSALSLISSSLT